MPLDIDDRQRPATLFGQDRQRRDLSRRLARNRRSEQDDSERVRGKPNAAGEQRLIIARGAIMMSA